MCAAASTLAPGFVGLLPIHEHLSGEDQRPRFLARLGQAALDDQQIQARPASCPALGTPVHDEVGQLAQAFRAFVERPQRQVRGQPFFFGHLARPLQTIDRRKRDLVLLRVFAGGFAQRFGRLLHVQHVVDNLKRQSHVFAEAGQRVQLIVVGARVDRRPSAGWPAAARRFWRDEWFPAAPRRDVCPRLPDRTPGRRSCRPRCPLRWRVPR